MVKVDMDVFKPKHWSDPQFSNKDSIQFSWIRFRGTWRKETPFRKNYDYCGQINNRLKQQQIITNKQNEQNNKQTTHCSDGKTFTLNKTQLFHVVCLRYPQQFRCLRSSCCHRAVEKDWPDSTFAEVALRDLFWQILDKSQIRFNWDMI